MDRSAPAWEPRAVVAGHLIRRGPAERVKSQFPPANCRGLLLTWHLALHAFTFASRLKPCARYSAAMLGTCSVEAKGGRLAAVSIAPAAPCVASRRTSFAGLPRQPV